MAGGGSCIAKAKLYFPKLKGRLYYVQIDAVRATLCHSYPGYATATTLPIIIL